MITKLLGRLLAFAGMAIILLPLVTGCGAAVTGGRLARGAAAGAAAGAGFGCGKALGEDAYQGAKRHMNSGASGRDRGGSQ
jgi:hypothetical protein